MATGQGKQPVATGQGRARPESVAKAAPAAVGKRGAPLPEAGAIEVHGLLDAQGTLLLAGWCHLPWPGQAAAEELVLLSTLGRLTGPATTIFLPEGARWRFVSLMRIPPVPRLEVEALELREPARRLPLAGGRPLAPPQAARQMRRLLADAPAPARHRLLREAPRLPFDAAQTLGRLGASAVHVELDRVMRAGDAGMVAMGWLFDPGRQVLAMRLCAGTRSALLDPAGWIVVPRPDVGRAIASYGAEGEEWGFCAWLPLVPPDGEGCYLEVELANGEVGQKAMPVGEAAGMASLRQLLALPRQAAPRLGPVMEATLGPAVEALNAGRLRRPCGMAEIAFGAQPAVPRISLVVTLYGRVDFMDLQLGLFSAAPDPSTEIIYVLDDPRLAAEAERLARSCHARHGLAFRLLLLEENLGFAPANNAGAALARGQHVCLMNSDVFPLAQEGMAVLAALADRLEADAGLGVVGPVLLYEDGTVQHAGMAYERVHGLPDWPFPTHPGKARPPAPGAGLQRALAITGACMMLRRADWVALGGFDEGYVIGDFEDSDLCLRIRERGLACAVDAGQRMFHLERQSQEGEAAWRFNTTLVNAWRHQRRWGGSPLLEGLPA